MLDLENWNGLPNRDVDLAIHNFFKNTEDESPRYTSDLNLAVKLIETHLEYNSFVMMTGSEFGNHRAMLVTEKANALYVGDGTNFISATLRVLFKALGGDETIERWAVYAKDDGERHSAVFNSKEEAALCLEEEWGYSAEGVSRLEVRRWNQGEP